MTDEVIQAPGDLFPRVPGIPSSGGVAMNPPPASLLGDIHQHIVAAMSDIPADGRGRLVTIATRTGDRTSVNLAIVAKHQFDNKTEVKVGAWMGKTWGQPVAVGVMGEVDF